MPELFSLRGFRVGVEGRSLFAGIELALASGEIVALSGPSGSGKSTLLRAVAGLIDPEEGEARLDGRAPQETGWPQWRRQVTYVAQEPVMLGGSVRDNLARSFSYRAVGGRYPEARAKEWLGELGLGSPEVLEQEAHTLSVGERQRVALVRALAIEPRVLLLDEPTSALDPRAARAAWELLRTRVAEGGAALAVTHDAEQTERFCDRRLDLEEYVVERRVA